MSAEVAWVSAALVILGLAREPENMRPVPLISPVII